MIQKNWFQELRSCHIIEVLNLQHQKQILGCQKIWKILITSGHELVVNGALNLFHQKKHDTAESLR